MYHYLSFTFLFKVHSENKSGLKRKSEGLQNRSGNLPAIMFRIHHGNLTPDRVIFQHADTHGEFEMSIPMSYSLP